MHQLSKKDAYHKELTNHKLLTHHAVYHVDFHGATSHMENHVGKLDILNHDKNHVVIHVVFTTQIKRARILN
jgi:hypothetical protein